MAVSYLGSQAVASGTIASSRPITVVSGTADAKGAYGTAHFTSTTYPAAWVQVHILRPAGNDVIVDVGVGAASSEVVIIPNLPISMNSTTSPSEAVWLFPLFIPAGSRIAARSQSPFGGVSVNCQITLFAPMLGGERGLGRVEACGVVTATSLGTSVDSGGTLNTYGAWAPLIASTSFAYRWGCVSINHTNALALGTAWAVDIGVGASGQEVVVVPGLCIACGATADTNPAIGLCFPLSIPAGTRVSARAQGNITTTSERLLEIVLHGVG